MSLGFERAGFDVVAAVEIDPVHAATHKYNFPGCAVLPRSVVGLDAAEIRLAAGLGRRKIDVVFGGAPCQGFSMIGHRAIDDPRNELVGEFVRLVSGLDADAFVFENVKGLTVGGHRTFLDELVEAFERRGYDVRRPWQVLNAAAFGVPQNRERLFLLGSKRGESLPDYPSPVAFAAGGRPQPGLERGPSVADALDDLPDAECVLGLGEGDAARASFDAPRSAYARRMRCLENDAWGFGRVRIWNPEVLTSSALTDHTAISRRRFAETAGGDVEPISRFFRLPAGGVSNTLRAGTDAARGAFTSPRPIHHRYARCVTVREMARLHGFPDWFRFNVTKWHGARQIGNAVPPPLAEAVAAQAIRALGYAPACDGRPLPLGDERLLSFDVGAAAAHFGVASPPARRDRKSGARKRKQADIEAAKGSALG